MRCQDPAGREEEQGSRQLGPCFRGEPLTLSPCPAQVFRCLPTDAVRSHRALRGHVAVGSLASLSPGRARERLQALRGLLVSFPLEFLAEEHLLPPLNCKEGMIPTEVWT